MQGSTFAPDHAALWDGLRTGADSDAIDGFGIFVFESDTLRAARTRQYWIDSLGAGCGIMLGSESKLPSIK
jgi:hypothetical protein